MNTILDNRSQRSQQHQQEFRKYPQQHHRQQANPTFQHKLKHHYQGNPMQDHPIPPKKYYREEKEKHKTPYPRKEDDHKRRLCEEKVHDSKRIKESQTTKGQNTENTDKTMINQEKQDVLDTDLLLHVENFDEIPEGETNTHDKKMDPEKGKQEKTRNEHSRQTEKARKSPTQKTNDKYYQLKNKYEETKEALEETKEALEEHVQHIKYEREVNTILKRDISKYEPYKEKYENTMEEIAEVKKRIKTIEEQKDAQTSKLMKEKSDLQIQSTKLKEQKDKTDMEIQVLQKNLECQKNESDKTIEKLNTDLKNTTARLELRIQQLHGETNDTEIRMAKLKEEMGNQNNTHRTKIQDLEKQNLELQTVAHDLTEELQKYKEELSNTKNEFKDQEKTQEENVASLQTEATQLKLQTQQLQRQYHDAKARIANLQNQVKDQEKVLNCNEEKLKQHFTELETLKENFRKEKETLNKTVNQLQAQLQEELRNIQTLDLKLKTESELRHSLSVQICKDIEFEEEKEKGRQKNLQAAAQEAARFSALATQQTCELAHAKNNLANQQRINLQQSRKNDKMIFDLTKRVTEGEILVQQKDQCIQQLQDRQKSLVKNLDQFKKYLEAQPIDKKSQEIFYESYSGYFAKRLEVLQKLDDCLTKWKPENMPRSEHEILQQQTNQNYEEHTREIKRNLEDILKHLTPEFLKTSSEKTKVHLDSTKLQDTIMLYQHTSTRKLVEDIKYIKTQFDYEMVTLPEPENSDRVSQTIDQMNKTMNELKQCVSNYYPQLNASLFDIVIRQFIELEKLQGLLFSTYLEIISKAYPDQREKLQYEDISEKFNIRNFDISDLKMITNEKYTLEMAEKIKDLNEDLLQDVEITYSKVNDNFSFFGSTKKNDESTVTSSSSIEKPVEPTESNDSVTQALQPQHIYIKMENEVTRGNNIVCETIQNSCLNVGLNDSNHDTTTTTTMPTQNQDVPVNIQPTTTVTTTTPTMFINYLQQQHEYAPVQQQTPDKMTTTFTSTYQYNQYLQQAAHTEATTATPLQPIGYIGQQTSINLDNHILDYGDC